MHLKTSEEILPYLGQTFIAATSVGGGGQRIRDTCPLS